MPELVPSSAPYRPSWEFATTGYTDGTGTFVPVIAPSDRFAIAGSGAVWSDHSDDTYASERAGNAYYNDGLTSISVTPYPVADLPAAPGVTSINSLTFRARGEAPPGNGIVAQWVLRNRTSGAKLVANDFNIIAGTPTNYSASPNYGAFSSALAFLQAGNLCVEVSLTGGADPTDLYVYDVWLDVNGEVPPPPSPSSTIRRAIVPPVTRAAPSLRMLQRGGSGGMAGIPRMIGDPTVRGSLRRGPGSIL